MNPNETTIDAPPDSVLPTYEEIVPQALGEGWSVCDKHWRRFTDADDLYFQRPSLTYSSYPGVWLGRRGAELPYLHLRRHTDGRRVRFEVPGRWPGGEFQRLDVIDWLRDVRRGRHADTASTSYGRHVRWLELAGCGGSSMAVRAGESIATTGGCLVEIPLSDSDIKQLSYCDASRAGEHTASGGSVEGDPLSPLLLGDLQPGDVFEFHESEFLESCQLGPLSNYWSGSHRLLSGGASETISSGGLHTFATDPERRVRRISRASGPVTSTGHGTATSNAAEQARLKDCWPGATTEQAVVLEALLAQQVATGGQDCAAARRLLMMRERLIAEEVQRAEKRALERFNYVVSANNDTKTAQAAGREQVPLTPGPLFWRRELPESQRR